MDNPSFLITVSLLIFGMIQMVSKDKVFGIIINCPKTLAIDEIILRVKTKLYTCLFCLEVFDSSNDLKFHLKKNHQNELSSNGIKKIINHNIEDTTEKIYYCPHCYFAVDANLVYSADEIIKHVKDCDANVRDEYGRRHVDLFFSFDRILIEKYSKGDLIIDIFKCLRCLEGFGTFNDLVNHIIRNHQREDFRPEDEEFLKNMCHSYLYNSKNVFGSVQRKDLIEQIFDTTKTVTIKAFDTKSKQDRSQLNDSQRLGNQVKPIVKEEIKGSTHSITITKEQIVGNYLKLPSSLKYLAIKSNGIVEVVFSNNWVDHLRFDSNRGGIYPIKNWFRFNAISLEDKVKLRILEIEPFKLKIWTEWEKYFGYLFKCSTEDAEFDNYTIRDCLIIVFKELRRPAHYRELYSIISKHRMVKIGTILGTLSRYREILFDHLNRGKWGLVQNINSNYVTKDFRLDNNKVAEMEIDDSYWFDVSHIEDDDLVYKLLSQSKHDLSYHNICKFLSNHFNIPLEFLLNSGFFNPNDSRLRRLDNGNFALEEWFNNPVEPLEEGSNIVESTREAVWKVYLMKLLKICETIYNWLIRKIYK